MAKHARGRPARRLALCALALVAACHHGAAPGASPSAADDDASARRGRGTSATEEDWSGQTATRVEELFEGRFPGVRVTAVPGQGIAVRIRGATSVNGSNEPLYVVDGFPLATSSDGLLALNPSDIARIEVLKDPGSTAEYGMRGANGVVLITTKRGR